MLQSYFIYIGAVLNALGTAAYLVNTVKGKVKPNRVSFLLWSVIPMIALWAQLQQGVGLEALMTFSAGFLPFTVFVASFFNKHSEWKLTRFDLICGMLSLAGLLFWQITKVGNIAIAFSILADALAAIPTLVKAYRYPETEIAWPWMATVVGIVLTLLTLSTFTFANCGFILYILTVNMLIFVLVRFKLGYRITLKYKMK